MMAERLLWDRFLFQIRESGLILEGGNILDIGTGTNTTTLEMFGDRWNVTPSDINVGDWNAHIPGMVMVDACKMSESVVADREWHGIILSEVLEHVVEPRKVLQQAWHLLQPGGVVVVTVPFMYRIHEYGDNDPETVEPGLLDYWRITPSGMALLMRKAGYNPFWVGRLVRGDKKTFPEFYCPEGVVAWGVKSDGKLELDERSIASFNAHHPPPSLIHEMFRQVPEEAFAPAIPDDWRQIQTVMAEKWRVENVNRESNTGGA